MTKLKPCPFCGTHKIVSVYDYPYDEKGVLIEYTVGNRYIIACKKCGCNIENYVSFEDVESKWNTRKIQEQLENKIKELEDAMEEDREFCDQYR